MKVVEVTVRSVKDKEVVSGTYQIESRKGTVWVLDTKIDFVTESPEATRKIILEDEQRLVIEGGGEMEEVYDKEQNAAKLVPKEVKVKPEKAERGAPLGAGSSEASHPAAGARQQQNMKK